MAVQQYKQWTVAVLFTVIVLGIAFALIQSRRGRVETGNQGYQKPPITESLIEFNAKERQLLDMVSKEPANAVLRARLGDLYFDNSRFEQAITEYKQALELNPEDVDTYNDLGLALFYTGSSERAIKTLKKGTEVESSYQRIWLSLGFVLASTEKKEEAREILKKAIEIAPDSDIGTEAKRILNLIQ